MILALSNSFISDSLTIIDEKSSNYQNDSKKWDIDSSNYLDRIELHKIYNNQLSNNLISYIISDSVNKKIIDDSTFKYFAFFNRLSKSVTIVLDNKKYENLKNELSINYKKYLKETCDSLSSRILFISIANNQMIYSTYCKDLDKDYNELLNILKQFFNDKQMEQFFNYMKRELN